MPLAVAENYINIPVAGQIELVDPLQDTCPGYIEVLPGIAAGALAKRILSPRLPASFFGFHQRLKLSGQ
jgi:hypothetical protein